MITAEQARLVSATASFDRMTTTLAEVETEIMLAAQRGYSSINWEKFLPAFMREVLCENGYVVKSDFLSKEITYNISWKGREQ